MAAVHEKLKLAIWLLCLTLVLAPLYVVRFTIPSVPLIGDYPMTLLEILIFLTIISWVFGKLITRSSVSRSLGISVSRGMMLSIFLFILAGLISIFISPDRRSALGSFKSYIAEPVLIYFVIKDIVKTKKALFMLFYSLLFSGLWLSVLAVFQGLFGWFVVTPHEMALGRAHGVYNTANALGLYLGPLVVLASGLLRYISPWCCCEFDMRPHFEFARPAHVWLHRLFLGGVVGLGIGAIILSKSAGAMVGLTAALAVLVLLVPFVLHSRGRGVLGFLWKKVNWLPCLLFLSSFLFVWLVVPHLTVYKITPPTRVFENTVRIRLCLWEGTRNLLFTTPLFGSGLAGFKEVYKNFRTCDDELFEYPHNIFLNFWVEMGLLGVVAFLLICRQWFSFVSQYLSISISQYLGASVLRYHGISVSRNNQDEAAAQRQWLPLAFLASLVYILIHGLVDVPYFKNDLALEFWVLLALLERYRLVANN